MANDTLTSYPYRAGECPPSYYVILQGVCAPLIIVISTVLNSLIAVVLLQKHLRSPTNILLLAIAFYDTLTGIFPFPAYIFVYTFRQCNDHPSYIYGWFHRISHDVLPFIFHTCSIWITVVLAIQRYIYVCHSEKAKRWCTVSMALLSIACVNILSLLVATPMFFEGRFHPKNVTSLRNINRHYESCMVHDFTEDPRYRKFFSIYSVIRAILINVGPCTILVILNAILVKRMKEAKQNREKLIQRRNNDSRGQEQTNVTLMLVIVVTIFLIVEIPMALYIILTAIFKLIGIQPLKQFFDIAVQLLNFTVLLSYPINFFIYCRMSRAFRDAFTKLLCPSLNENNDQRLQSTATPLLAKTGVSKVNSDRFESIKKTSTEKETQVQPILSSSVIGIKIEDGIIENNKHHTNEHSNKSHVSFGDDVNQSTCTKFTNL